MLLALALLAAPGAGPWQSPLPGALVIQRAFDPPAHPWLPGNRGVDLLGRPGEEVFAAGAGRVSFAGRVARVPVVAIRHPDGLESTYEPVKATVAAGQWVSAGQLIGRLVAAASHCPPRTCLHWGLRRAGHYLDPLGLLGLQRVRLLPMDNPGPASAAIRTAKPLALAGFAVTVVAAGPIRRRRARSRRSRRSTTASPPAPRRRRRAMPSRAAEPPAAPAARGRERRRAGTSA